jgi:hypothetical protein
MASELKVDKFTGVTTAGSILVTGEGNSTTTNLQQGLAKCWVNFKMAASFVTNDSLNVASITDNGTGDGTVNINNDMNNDDYCVTVSAQSINILNAESSQAAGLFQILTYNASVAASDYQVSASVHGDLA